MSDLVELRLARRDVFIAEDDAAYLRRPNVVHDIQGDTVVFENTEIFGKARPALRELVQVELGEGAIVLRRKRQAFSGHHRCDALAELALGGDRIAQEGKGAPAHHVDEAGCHDAPRRIDDAFGAGGVELTDLRDEAV